MAAVLEEEVAGRGLADGARAVVAKARAAMAMAAVAVVVRARAMAAAHKAVAMAAAAAGGGATVAEDCTRPGGKAGGDGGGVAS